MRSKEERALLHKAAPSVSRISPQNKLNRIGSGDTIIKENGKTYKVTVIEGQKYYSLLSNEKE